MSKLEKVILGISVLSVLILVAFLFQNELKIELEPILILLAPLFSLFCCIFIVVQCVLYAINKTNKETLMLKLLVIILIPTMGNILVIKIIGIMFLQMIMSV